MVTEHPRTKRKCSYSYIHNSVYRYKQKHGIYKATLNILSRKWKPTQMIQVFDNLNTLFSTQYWPRPDADLYTNISNLSKIYKKRIKDMSATTIQKAYLHHLYKPTHGWHIRQLKSHLNVSNIVL